MQESIPRKKKPVEILSELGFRMFRILPGTKVPAESEFYARATRTPSFSPPDYNLGLAMGEGLMALDFDVKPDKGIDARDTLAAYDLMGLPQSVRFRTPSGGIHVVLRVPPGQDVANSESKIAPGVDVRGHHGYLVGPGSVIPAGSYDFLAPPIEIADAPDWLLSLCRRPREKTLAVPLTDLDTPEAIKAVRDWLSGPAPYAIERAGGDAATYAVACRVKDFGVSEPVALDLLAEHWNPTKAIPPWDTHDLARKVANAYSYGTSAPGEKSPGAEFTDPLTPEQIAAIEESRHRRPSYEDQPDTAPRKSLSDFLRPLDPFDIATDVRRREPVLGTFLYRRFVAALISPPGVGKTTFGIQAALSIATGRPLLGPRYAPRTPPSPAFYWTQEDDLDEIRLRLTAAMRHFGLTWEDTLDPDGISRLHLCSGVERPLAMAVYGSDRKTILASQDAADVLRYLQGHGIASAVFDPLTELHPADENDNGQVGRVARIFRTIAVKADVALCIVHHTRKPAGADAAGAAGDMNSGRGAGALMGVVRSAKTMYALDSACAKTFGVADADRHRYVRIDDAKSNISLISGTPDLFRRVSVPIVETGDEVGVLEPATDLVARESAEVGASDFAKDVRFVVEAMLTRGVRAVGWVQVAEALLRDEYEGGDAAPGKYATQTEKAIRVRTARLFDGESGAPVSPVLSGLTAVDSSGKGRFIRRTEDA